LTQAVRRDLGFVGADLDRQVAPGRGRLELVAGEDREWGERPRSVPDNPKRSSAVSKSEAPKPTVTVTLDTGRERASPESAGGVEASSIGGAAGTPAVSRADTEVQVRRRSMRSDRLVVVRSNDPNETEACGGVVTPA